MYIGKGLRHSTQDRLENPKTLQRILAQVNSNSPDDEVFALVYAFEYAGRREAGVVTASIGT